MNLEKDINPTGLYNYLPKIDEPRKTRRRRKSTRRIRKTRTFRSKVKYGRKK